jgi:hypothetical protein
VGATFGGTDSILVEVTPDARVAALHFAYPAIHDFAASVAEYTASLGPPIIRAEKDSAGGRVEAVAWRDARTSFVLSQFRQPGRPVRVPSVLRNTGGP